VYIASRLESRDAVGLLEFVMGMLATDPGNPWTERLVRLPKAGPADGDYGRLDGCREVACVR
jgi:hypothetical protein